MRIPRRLCSLMQLILVMFTVVNASEDLHLQLTVSSENEHSPHAITEKHPAKDHGDSLQDSLHAKTKFGEAEKVTVGVGRTPKQNTATHKIGGSSTPFKENSTEHQHDSVTHEAIVRPTTKRPVTHSSTHNTTESPIKSTAKTRVMFARYKNMKRHFRDKMYHSLQLYDPPRHIRRRGHLYFFNQFIYELKTLQSCFYQFVKKGCTLSVYYQNLDTEPLTVYITDQHNMVLHDNNLQKSGNFNVTAKESNIYEICLENFSWEAKKVFLSIRVESHRNSRVMMQPHHPKTYTVLGHIRNLEVEVRSMQAHLWYRKARHKSDMIADVEKDSFVHWITWVVVISALVIFLLQVVEIHRVVRSAEMRFSGNAAYVRVALRDPKI